MKRSALWETIVIIGFLLLTSVRGVAATNKPAGTQEPAPKQAALDICVLFNTTIIPLDLQAYQSGFGVKMGRESLYVRGLLDLVVNGASESFGMTLGATTEYHITPEPLSFYVGGTVSTGYIRQSNAYSSFVLSVGGIAGIEYFPLKFISMFVEYELAADLTWTTNLVTLQKTFDYLVDTRMGNDSRIGVVVHLLRLLDK